MKKKEGKKMVCPNNAGKDFDDLDCRDCQWYFQCFKMWQSGNIYGKDEGGIGENYPMFKDEEMITGVTKSGMEHLPQITQKEIDKFKIELGEIIYFSDWEKKINAF
jgi:hypothetical protein